MRRLRARTLCFTLVLSAPILFAQTPQAPEPFHPPLVWQTSTATAHPDDLLGTTITLSRGPCLAVCPAYHVTITGDGTVKFFGYSSVFADGSAILLPGAHIAHISLEKVRELKSLLLRTHLFDWDNRADVIPNERYSHAVQGPDVAIALDINGLSGRVLHYYTDPVPIPIRALAAEIDEAVDTNRWLKGDAATLPSLVAENWQFGSNESRNMDVYRAVIRQKNEQLIDLYVQAHAPIVAPMLWQDSPVCVATEIGDIDLVHRMTDNPTSLPPEVRWQCLRSAAVSGSLPLARFWLEAGADPATSPLLAHGPMEMVEAAIAGGNPDIVRIMLDHNLPLDDKGAFGPLLILLLSRSQPTPRFKELFQMLLAHGLDPDALDREGNTALMEAHGYHHDEVVPWLLEAGADINHRNTFGLTLLLEYAEDEPFLRKLLAAGADPAMQSNDGRTALDYAREGVCTACVTLLQNALARKSPASTPPNL